MQAMAWRCRAGANHDARNCLRALEAIDKTPMDNWQCWRMHGSSNNDARRFVHGYT